MASFAYSNTFPQTRHTYETRDSMNGIAGLKKKKKLSLKQSFAYSDTFLQARHTYETRSCLNGITDLRRDFPSNITSTWREYVKKEEMRTTDNDMNNEFPIRHFPSNTVSSN